MEVGHWDDKVEAQGRGLPTLTLSVRLLVKTLDVWAVPSLPATVKGAPPSPSRRSTCQTPSGCLWAICTFQDASPLPTNLVGTSGEQDDAGV